MRIGRFVRSWTVAAAVAVTGILAVAENASATATGAPVWTSMGPYDSGLAAYPYFSSITCTSAGDCIAVGGANPTGEDSESGISSGSLSASEPVFALESAGTWGPTLTVFDLPNNASTSIDASDELESVACPSATSCVAVGSYSNSTGGADAMVVSIDLTDGHAVATATEISPPAPAAAESSQAAALHSLSCASAGCEAVGQYVDSSGITQPMLASPGADGTWSAVTVGRPADATGEASLNAISCPSAGGACEAVGNYADASGDDYPWVIQVEGGMPGSPQLVTLPANFVPVPVNALLTPISLTDVSCPSAGACTAAGTYDQTNYVVPVVNGTAGTVVNLSRFGVGVGGLSCADASDCLVGDTVIDGLTTDGGFDTEDAGVWGPGPSGGLYTGSQGIALGPVESLWCADATNCVAYIAEPVGFAPPFFVTLAPPATGNTGTTATPPNPVAKIVKVSSKGTSLTVTIGCSAAACKGTAVLTAVEHLKGSKLTEVTARAKSSGQSKTKTVTLAKGSYAIAAGESATVKLTLNGTAAKLLTARKRLPAKLALTPTGSKTATATTRVTLKARTRK